MKPWIVGTIFILAAASVGLSQSVVQPGDSTLRFPKAYKELEKQTKPPSNNWLLDANDDTERFRRLQVVLSGTDLPMWEIAYRYEELHVAIQKNNWEMGVYHWEKVRDRINTAAMKRPVRTQNIEGMFLDSGVWKSMHDALISKDPEKMRTQFQFVRQTCMACHIADNVGFLNESSVFKKTEMLRTLDK
jgi:transcriptional regulator NrdR family protein